MSNRLVCRSILSHGNAVVRKYVNHAQAHDRSQAYRGFHVIREHEECRTEGENATMRGHAIDGCAHRMLANAEGNIAARIAPRAADRAGSAWRFLRRLEIALLLQSRVGGGVQIG